MTQLSRELRALLPLVNKPTAKMPSASSGASSRASLMTLAYSEPQRVPWQWPCGGTEVSTVYVQLVLGLFDTAWVLAGCVPRAAAGAPAVALCAEEGGAGWVGRVQLWHLHVTAERT